MSWLTPSLYERELLENLRSVLSPEILCLAKYCVLTPRIEPLLLRNMRIALIPASEPELEHQLWYSAVISARSTRDIVLHQGVARLLADELRGSDENPSEEFAKVWEYTQSYTRHWSALDKLEQQLRYDALRNQQSAIDIGLQEILRAINRAPDKDSRLALARWAKKTLPAIAGKTTTSKETAWLAQYAATTLGATANWTKLSANQPIPEWLQTTPITSSAKIGLQLRHDAGLGYQVLECLRAEESSITLPLPAPLPARLYIQCENQSEGVWEIINPGSRIKIAQPSRRIFLSTIDGKRYELLVEFDPASSEPTTAEAKIYLTYVREDHDLAQQILHQLTEQNIQVTLLQDSPGISDFTQSHGNSRFLHLWTPAAKRQWQNPDWAETQMGTRSLLLQWQQTQLPQGASATQVINLDDVQHRIQDIQQWLEAKDMPMDNRVDILLLQQALNDLGANPKLVVDGLYGPRTKQAVKRFQKQVKVTVDGIVGPVTNAAIQQRLEAKKKKKPLENKENILWLQKALNDLGAIPKLVVDGIDGPLTKQAVKHFQASAKINADGVAGPMTQAAIHHQLKIHNLLNELENPETKPRRRLEIGDQLAELGDPRKGVGVIEYEVIEYAPQVQILLDELNDINTPSQRRLEIGDQLDAMGDPRPGVGLDANRLPDIDWVEIPAGPFIYGAGETQQTIELPAYKISRYPVTNSQFQAFIDAGGYQDERWWQDLEKPNPEKPRWAQANRPRETVNWYEAIAYTRWLSAQLGINVRLPTEQQWEKAARGPQGLVFPWGNEFRSGFANGDYDLKQTSAVGIYPHGKSPYQVADMAGNVMEWCLNDYEHPERVEVKPEVLTDKDGIRYMDSEGSLLETMSGHVLRGGSWLHRPVHLRSAYRAGFNADIHNYNVGFRLALD